MNRKTAPNANISSDEKIKEFISRVCLCHSTERKKNSSRARQSTNAMPQTEYKKNSTHTHTTLTYTHAVS